MILRYDLPRFVEINTTTSLNAVFYDDAGDVQTTTSGTIDVYLGARKIVDGAAITPGAESTYSLTAATTTSEAPSDSYLEVWTVVIDGSTYVRQREGYLVRRAYYPIITDTDLTDRRTELASFLSVLDISTYEKYRAEANVELQLDLIAKGRRPWLIFDRSAARRLHITKTLQLIDEDFAAVAGNGRAEKLAARSAARYDALLNSASFRYDENESGTIDTESHESASGPVFITAGPPRRDWGYR